jgi:Ca2+-binding EF-hand superfamily protein
VQDIEAVWKELDLYNSGTIRHPEMIQGLRMLGIRLKDSTIATLMKRFADPKNTTGDISRAEFFELIRYLLEQVPSPKSPRDEEAHAKALLAAEEEVARVLPHNSKERIYGAMAPFDLSGSGALTAGEFRAMLEELGATTLSDSQHEDLFDKYSFEGVVDLRNFAGLFFSNHGGEHGALALHDKSDSPQGSGIGGASNGHGRHHAGHIEDDLDESGNLGLGGPHAIALIKRNTSGTYPSLLSSRKGYPPWAKVGVQPLVDPLTMQPLTMDKLVRAPARV